MSRLFLGYYGEVTLAAGFPVCCRALPPLGSVRSVIARTPQRGVLALSSAALSRFPDHTTEESGNRARAACGCAGPASPCAGDRHGPTDHPRPKSPSLIEWSGRAESNRREEFGKLPFYH